MMPSYSELKNDALQKLDKKWGAAAVVVLILIAINLVLGLIPIAGSVASIIVSGPLSLGMAGYFLNLSRNQAIDTNNLFDGFKNFANALVAYLLMLLIVLVGILLLIVPGIIAALALSQTYNIMRDNPSMSAMDAMKRSHELMTGHRGEYFVLNLTFIGWAFLCLLTLGIGFLFLVPYIATTNANFYNHLISYENKQIEELGADLVS
jgi:uncharacterized membrane protein